jgi:hypothetical protein
MSLKTSLIILHLIGLAIGVGAATLLDLIIMRFMVLGRISRDHVKVVHLAAHMVTGGLALLWITGIAFLSYYYYFAPDSLANPKVHAKIAIVLVLTLNGLLVHKYILPTIANKEGRHLFDEVSVKQQTFMLACGTISAVSWYVPIVLGATREWNFAMPASTILLGYLGLLSLAILAAQVLGRILVDGHHYLRFVRALPELVYYQILKIVVASIRALERYYRWRRRRMAQIIQGLTAAQATLKAN